MKENDGDIDFSGLKESLFPKRDLWPAIRSRIKTVDPIRVKRGFVRLYVRPVLGAALIASVLIFGINLGASGFFIQEKVPPHILAVNKDYRYVKSLILLDLSHSMVDSSVAQKIRKNFDAIDRSVDEIIGLIQEEGENPLLLERLYEINRTRFEFLESIRRLLLNSNTFPVDRIIRSFRSHSLKCFT